MKIENCTSIDTNIHPIKPELTGNISYINQLTGTKEIKEIELTKENIHHWVHQCGYLGVTGLTFYMPVQDYHEQGESYSLTMLNNYDYPFTVKGEIDNLISHLSEYFSDYYFSFKELEKFKGYSQLRLD